MMRSWVLAASVCTAVVMIGGSAGCASTVYDPAPPDDASVEELTFTVPLDVERSYRLLHERLEACAGTGHHVQPRYEHAPPRAWIMVVSGLGLDRLSLLGNQFEARFAVEPVPEGTRVSVTYVGKEMEGLARAVPGWLVHGNAACGA